MDEEEFNKVKKRLDVVASELFHLQDLRQKGNLPHQDLSKLQFLEAEYYDLTKKLASKTISSLEQEGLLK